MKHLHSLEIFTAGHNVVDLESTALHNLKELLEFESSNSYSQAPSLYFIYNLDKDKVKEVMSLKNIRCVLNVRESVPELVNGNAFIFYNKKNGQFLNLEKMDLDFEEHLITSSGSKEVLQDMIQKIKVISSRIFAELNQDSSLECLPELLKEFDQKYWKKILDFTEIYFDIEIPNISQLQVLENSSEKNHLKENIKDYSDEYTTLVSTNKTIGKEFIQLLHDYRIKKVNSSHLGLGQLFNPLELYNYLRNHHWKEGIPASFAKEWQEMKLSQYELTEQDQLDFETILKSLGVKSSETQTRRMTPYQQLLAKKNELKIVSDTPSPSSDWKEFKTWMYSQLNVLEKSADKILVMEPKLQSEILANLAALAKLVPNKKAGHVKKTVEVIPQTKLEEKPSIVFVDTTNILNEDKDANGLLKVENIAQISKELESQGYDYEHIIDASSRYKFNNVEQIDTLLKEGKVTQSPYGRKADVLVLEYAKRFKGKILSNDGFTDKAYREKYGSEWIFNNRLTCKFMRGNFIIL